MSKPRLYPSTVEFVTPEMARAWLAGAAPNRAISRATVDAYAFEMSQGKWRHTPVGIQFNPSGQLIDGRHRLSAIVASGVSVWMTVIRDVPADVSLVLDTGRIRKPSESIAISTGAQRTSIRQAIFATMYRLERGANPRMTIELYQTMERNLGFDHVERVSLASRSKLNSCLGAALVYARPIDIAMVDQLQAKLVNRECMPGTEAAILRLSGDSRLLAQDRAGSCRKFMRGVMAYITGESIDRLQDGTVGYSWLQAKRESMGLLSRVVPESYTRVTDRQIEAASRTGAETDP
jgi:hypothetical protein